MAFCWVSGLGFAVLLAVLNAMWRRSLKKNAHRACRKTAAMLPEKSSTGKAGQVYFFLNLPHA